MNRFLLCFGLIMLLSFSVYSQDLKNPDKLFEYAVHEFEQEDYHNACLKFNKLLESDPNETMYLYYSARCLTEMNRDLDKAAEYLRFAISYGEYPDAYFQLGRVYHLTYRFGDAIEAYRNYLSKSKTTGKDKNLVERNIEIAKNGQDLISNSYTPDVISKKIIHKSELDKEFVSPIGRVIKKPQEFYSKYENKINSGSFIFFPKKTKAYDYVYFAGYSDKGKGGRQIFRIKNISDQTWSESEMLGNEINTKYDEDFSYYDPETAKLYFSSKGHNSMGGYDVFVSTYDWNKKQWSQPENMGFPVNSPFDDYLYIPDKFNKKALLCSDRSVDKDHVVIYEILITDTTPDNNFSYNDIIHTANLDVNVTSEELQSRQNSNSGITNPKKWNRNLEEQYNMIIAEALEFQEASDSISDMIKENRILLKLTKDNNEKSEISNLIASLTHEQQKLQTSADDKYHKAEMLKGKYFDNETGDTDNNPREYTVNPGEVSQIAGQQDNSIAQADLPFQNSLKIRYDVPVNDTNFKIMDHSPYNDSNPVPVNIELPEKLIYRIQLGAFSIPRSNDFYKGLYPVSCEKQDNAPVTKYYAGLFNSLKNAKTALQQIKDYGYSDAFIVAFYKNEKIDLEKAIEIEYKNNF